MYTERFSLNNLRIPSRPIRYAIHATHALRGALEQLQERLEAMDEATYKPAKHAEKQTAKRSGASAHKTRAKR